MDDQKILDNEVFEAVEVLDGEGLNLALTHYSKQLNAYMVRDESEWYSYCDKSGCLIDEYAQSDLRSLADIKELVELRKANAELKKIIKELTDGVTHFNRSRGDISPLLEAYTKALKAGKQCNHDFVCADNEKVIGSEICKKCHLVQIKTIKAGN
jgi:hypothetical protein